MTLKKARSPRAFIAPLPLTSVRPQSPRCPVRLTLRCAASKLLVIELSEILRKPNPAHMKTFTERVSADRAKDTDTTFVLYSSDVGYAQAMEQMEKVGLIQPDALATFHGTELYQRRYKTPDPYWAKMVCKDWDPKPTRWVIGEYFKTELKHCPEDSDDFGLIFECKKKKQDRTELCREVEIKLEQMGITARVGKRGESRNMIVTPAAGSVGDLVGFCQMMLRISEKMTFVFGGSELVNKSVQGKENLGIYGKDAGIGVKAAGEQVFVSEKNGIEALMEGVMFHDIL
ncbi:unnamed protein product [Chondrus crispus]|uniref:Sucrose phosphatase-like domain-containing protein n=1 Tax=Chondrus crispus TaxID=2769 RepID=R7QTG1_CHOCR|nr:unnamed protein product [Chondrus crispus]CDF40801.1 unnamed protein product [Chondrus crispus]|eukprot:XP_005711095.1 unnamed protein product [Chondrus crispus]